MKVSLCVERGCVPKSNAEKRIAPYFSLLRVPFPRWRGLVQFSAKKRRFQRRRWPKNRLFPFDALHRVVLTGALTVAGSLPDIP
jgi:hypothetical protein